MTSQSGLFTRVGRRRSSSVRRVDSSIVFVVEEVTEDVRAQREALAAFEVRRGRESGAAEEEREEIGRLSESGTEVTIGLTVMYL